MSGSAARKAAVVAGVLVAVLVGPAAGRAAAQTIWISVKFGEQKIANATVTVVAPGGKLEEATPTNTQQYITPYRGAGTYRFTVVAPGYTFERPHTERIRGLDAKKQVNVTIPARPNGRAEQSSAGNTGGGQGGSPPPQGSRVADTGPGASRGPTSPAGRNEAAPSRTPPPPVPDPAPAGETAGGEHATPQESPSEPVPDAPTQAEPEPVTTVDREQTDDARNLGTGQRVTITVVDSSSGGSFAWIVAGGFALLAVAFQALALVRGQPRRGGGRDHGVTTRLAELREAVARLRYSADAGVRQWKQAEALAAEARMTAESTMTVPVAQWRDDDDRASRPSTDQTIVKRPSAVPTSMPVETYMPVEVSSPVAAAAPPAPRGLMADYTRTRQSSNHERAASEFEGQYVCARLSLVNSDEVRANPKVLPEFEVAGRGFFIAVDEGGQWKCFPWFTTSLAEESFRSVFDFRGAEASRLTQPARLDKRGDKWVLAVRGQIDSNA